MRHEDYKTFNRMFNKEQRRYIGNALVRCWKECHNEHCHKSHDCNNDIQGLIDTLTKFGLSENEIYASVLGAKLEISL